MNRFPSPYKTAAEISFWQMTVGIVLLAGFFIATSVCFLLIMKGIIELLKA